MEDVSSTTLKGIVQLKTDPQSYSPRRVSKFKSFLAVSGGLGKSHLGVRPSAGGAGSGPKPRPLAHPQSPRGPVPTVHSLQSDKRDWVDMWAASTATTAAVTPAGGGHCGGGVVGTSVDCSYDDDFEDEEDEELEEDEEEEEEEESMSSVRGSGADSRYSFLLNRRRDVIVDTPNFLRS